MNSAKDIAALFTAGTLATAATITRLAQSPQGQQGIFLGMAVGGAIFYVGWNAGSRGRASMTYLLVGFAIALLLTFWGAI